MKNETRKTITLPIKLWDAISNYRFEHRITTEAEALRRILATALKVK